MKNNLDNIETEAWSFNAIEGFVKGAKAQHFHRYPKTIVTPDNIVYGELVDVFGYGITTSCKVHFFNSKGVLVGRLYVFVPYSIIRRRESGDPFFTQIHYQNGRCSQWIYERYCHLISILIRKTQKTAD